MSTDPVRSRHAISNASAGIAGQRRDRRARTANRWRSTPPHHRSSKSMTTTTGPKISSRATWQSLSTLGQHGRLVVEAHGRVARRSASRHARAVLDGVGDVAVHSFDGRSTDQWSHAGRRIGRIPDADLADLLATSIARYSSRHRSVHQVTGGQRTPLAGVERALWRQPRLAIARSASSQTISGALAAHLEDEVGEAGRRPTGDRRADCVRAGEADHVDAADRRSAASPTVGSAGHDVEHPVWQPGLLRRLRDQQRGVRASAEKA